jgi:hypothetical protein
MNKCNIPVLKDRSVYQIPLNCIDHYNTMDGSINYRRTLNKYNNTGIFIRRINNVQK